MNKLAELIFQNTLAGKINKETGAELLNMLKLEDDKSSSQPIAIIGMSGKFPQANNLEEFWNNIQNGMDCISAYPKDRVKDSNSFALNFTNISEDDIQYANGGYLQDIDKFDYNFFRISPREASLMDPNQRLFLETAWKAIEDSGYGGKKLVGSNTGIFLGYANAPLYSQYITKNDPSLYSMAVTGNVSSIIASRIAYLLDLKGPSMLIDTACSSSLVALHMACRSIKMGDCDLAIAGGVKIDMIPIKGITDIGIESSENKTRTFDEDSTGTVWGEGVAAVLLKPLSKAIEDNDNIYAIIKGSAINQDGTSVGITAPNVLAQTDVIVNAWNDAKINPETISYIEAHGTGTKLGDPIEIDGINRAFKKFTNKKQFCGIGSLKTNIGHLDNVSGIAGLVKAVLALNHKKIPPMINLNRPNQKIDFIESPVYICDKLENWESDGNPRRCGVSSFGFSGTNCHVVLEEAPYQKVNNKNTELKLFTISAKTIEQLEELVNEYNIFIQKNSQTNIDNLCYTANTGRGHYNHRLAIIVKDKEDFIYKISKIALKGLREENTPEVYIGEYKIVVDNKVEKNKNELTNNEISDISSLAHSKLIEFTKTKNSDRSVLMDICKLYVKGAEINFNSLYNSSDYNIISLPTYTFMRNRCWIETKTSGTLTKEIPYALLEKCLSETMYQDVYLTRYSQEKYWVATDHRVKGVCVPAGTVYMEMAAEACKKYFIDKKMELFDIIMLSPIAIYDGEIKDVQTIVKKQKGYFEFTIASKKAKENEDEYEWVTHSQGKAREFNDIRPQNYDIEYIKKKCSDDYHVPNNSNYNDLSMMWFGPRWKNIIGVHIGKNETLTRIELPDEYIEEFESFILQPALIDNALSTYIVQDGNAYLPFSCKSIKIFDKLPSKFYSHVRATGEIKQNAEILVYDVTLISMDGEVVVEIEGSTRKKVYSNPFTPKVNFKETEVYHDIIWTPYQSKIYAKNNYEGSILVFKGDNRRAIDICDRFKEKGKHIIEVEIGTEFKKLSQNNYIVSTKKEDYYRLISEVKNDNIVQILHLLLLSDEKEINQLKELCYKQEIGVTSLFYLTKAILDSDMGNKVDIVLISDYVNKVTGDEAIIKPENAPLFGFGKVVGQEYSKISCRCIDIDEDTSIDNIFEEIQCMSDKIVVAYRKNCKYIEQLKKLDKKLGDRVIDIKPEGVYIITGGTGGVGLEIAKYLASRNRVNIALVNRSKFPEKAKWDSIINESKDHKIIGKIKKLIEIEQTGSSISFYSADISKEDDVKLLFDQLRQLHGKINGIIHGAAVAGDGFIINKNEETFQSVIYPKIQGTWIMDKVTEHDELDFFVLFSSGVSITGLPGQSDYTAANSYLDSFSLYRNMRGKKTIVINWTAWREVGMAFDNNINVDDAILKPMDNFEAIRAFSEVLNSDIHRVVIGAINYEYNMLQSTTQLPIELSLDILNNIEKSRRRSESINTEVHTINKTENLVIKGRESEAYSQTEKEVAKIFAAVLAINQIDIYDNFYELGGDSLIGLNIINEIETRMGLKVEITDLFKNLTIADFSKFLDETYGKVKMDDDTHISQIKKVEEKEYYSLSPVQMRMFILNQLNKNGTEYNLCEVMQIDGELDIVRFEQAFKKIVERHEILRTSFHSINGEIVQRVNKDIEFKISYYESEAEKVQELIKEFIKPYDLSKAPLIRIGLVKIKENKHVVISDMHHIVSDGTSISILVQEFISLYTGGQLPEIKIQYKDFVEWQKEFMSREVVQKQEKFWLNVFNKDIQVLNLPLDYIRSAAQDYSGDNIKIFVDTKMTEAIKKFASDKGTTLFTILFSVYNLLLHKYSGQEDIIIGVPVAGRQHRDISNLIGVFINTLAMRNNVSSEISYIQFLNKVKDNAFNAFANQDYQFDNLLHKLSEKNIKLNNPIFNTIFNLVNIINSEIKIQGLSFSYPEYPSRDSKIDIELLVVENSDGLEFKFEYRTSLFKKDTIQNFAENYIYILNQVIEKPDIKLSQINMRLEENKKVIYKPIDINRDVDKCLDYNTTIAEIFENKVNQIPNNIAVIYKGQSITYEKLNEKANALAAILVNRGIKKDTIVGIILERSTEMMISVLSVFKAGGAYLPIDPNYPIDRINFMLEDSRAVVCITSKDIKNKIGILKECIYVEDIQNYTHEKVNVEVSGEDLAYVIYTSGSTGNPKGTMIEQRSLVNRLLWMQKEYPIDERDTILQKTPYTFDVSLWELFWWIINGSKVCFLEPEKHKDPKAIVEEILKNNITIVHFVPSMLGAFMDYVELAEKQEDLKSLRHVFASGETLNKRRVDKFKELLYYRNGTKLHNLYGPTEATVDVSYFDCMENLDMPIIPIGKPIDNIKLYILSKEMKLLHEGEEGELYISGIGLSRGYLNREELNKEKFIDNPFAVEGHERIYKTGDLARLISTGDIEFLGRIDNQVKIRGFRIELEEIESQLLKIDGIKEAVVKAFLKEDQESYLCAYLVVDIQLPISEIKSKLLGNLPDYMVPTYFVYIERMPLTPNGKIDRKALLEPNKSMSDELEFVAATSETEKDLTMIWQEVLGIDRIGINDNFFKVGGHSLKATTLMAKIYKRFNIEIPLEVVFDKPTIKDMSSYIQQSWYGEYSPIAQLAESEYYQVSSAQRRLLILDMMELGKSIAYNMPFALRIEGELSINRLEKVFSILIMRHEALRTSFDIVDEYPIQRIYKDTSVSLEYVEAWEKDLKETINNLIKPFDLSQAPLLRINIIKIIDRPDEHILFIDMHHIISDGVSISLLAKEFMEIYNGEILSEITIQYKDFAKWQNDLMKTESYKRKQEYWLKVFEDDIPTLNLPLDYERPLVQSFKGNTIEFSIETDLTLKLNKIATDNNSTLYMVLLAAYNILLSKYTGEEDIVIGSPISGRTHADVQNIIGMFVNTLAMRNYPNAEKTFKVFLNEVRNSTIRAFENQDVQFEDIVEKLNVRRDASRNPIFDTMFALQNIEQREVQIDNLIFSDYKFDNNIAKFDITLNSKQQDNILYFSLQYCTELFSYETMNKFTECFKNILKAIANNPQVKLSDIDMLSQEEKIKILYEFNRTEESYPKDKTIHQLFEEQVAMTPNNIAVVSEEGELTYNHLNEKANSIARTLRDTGVKQDSIVGIIVDNTLEMIVGIMAVLKAGGAYLPIDPEYPKERIKFILEDSEAQIVLTKHKYFEKINLNIKVLDIKNKELYNGLTSNLESISNPKDLVYIIYTSGTSGNPKGVLIQNYNLVNYVNWFTKKATIDYNDKSILLSSFCFDLGYTSLFPTLLAGGQLHITKKEFNMDIENLAGYLEKSGITYIKLTPSLFSLLLNTNTFSTPNLCKQLRLIVLGGEIINWPDIEKFHDIYPDTKIINHYGPTETCIGTIAEFINFQELKNYNNTPIIGKPIHNSKIYILDNNLNIVPINCIGQIYVSGDGVARSYLNRPDITEERFISNPFIPGEIMYSTGDLAKWTIDGEIRFYGRKDEQVKIRGFRVEVSEIENLLLKHDLIKEAAVIAKDDTQGNKYLISYVVCKRDIPISEIRKYLLKQLPDYMIPTYFMQLENIPLTPNGKIDKKSLPKPIGNSLTDLEYVEPSNEIERKLATVWQDILGLNNIGVNDNFFEIGGDSIKAIQVLSRMNKYNMKFGMRDLFNHPTISGLQGYVRYMNKQGNNEEITGSVLLTPIQLRFFNNKFHGMNHYNQSIMLFKKDGFNEGILCGVFNEIVKHHDALRLVFKIEEGQIIQYYKPFQKDMIELKIFDLRDNLNLEEDIEKEANKLQESIDLANGPLIKLGLFRTNEGDHLLVIIHHLVIDGVSWRILLEDFSIGYKNLLNNQKIQFQAKTTSFREWAQHLKEYSDSDMLLKEKQYWSSLENNVVTRSFELNEIREYKSVNLKFSIDETQQLLKRVNHVYNTEINHILLTALGYAIKIAENQDKVLVNLEGHGREDIIDDINITRTVGWFTSAYPVILDMSGDNQCSESIQLVRDTLRNIPSKGIGYSILKLLTSKENKKELTFKLNPEISFNYLGQFDEDIDTELFEMSKMKMGQTMSGNCKRLFNLDINGIITNNQLDLNFSYNTKRYKEEDIKEIVHNYKKCILEIIHLCGDTFNNKNVGLVSLVELKKTGTKTPIFMVHGVDGQISHYSNLSRYINENRPLYAFKSLARDDMSLDSIPKLAKIYIQGLKQVQPKGPYIIGGHSMGALIAHEMTYNLIQAGEEIRSVILMDQIPFSDLPFQFKAESEGESFIKFIGFVQNLFNINIYNAYTKIRKTSMADIMLEIHSLTENERINILCECIKELRMTEAIERYAENNISDYFDKLYKVYKRNIHALSNYETKHSYKCNAIIFHTRELKEKSSNDALSWKGVIDGNISIIEVPGDHISMMKEPHVKVIANELNNNILE